MGSTPSTHMFHFLCRECGMSATIVSTPAGHDAWEDHMLGHSDARNFTTWTWEALRIPFEELER